jgi:hypothetical protein
MRLRQVSIRISILGMALSLCAVTAQAKDRYSPEQIPPNPEQMELIQKSFAREKVAMQEIRKHAPLVQTYIQNMRPDPTLGAVPRSDEYLLSRVDFSKVFTAKAYESRADQGRFFKSSAKSIELLTRLFGMSYSRDGFMAMMFIDPSGYDSQHYDFSFVRREFLGNVRTDVFDVYPKPGTGSGRFLGRVWIEDQNGNIVRFNGTYIHGPFERAGHYWAHFDSWRTNMEPDVWLPTAIYVEEDNQPESLKPQGFHAQTFFWGYSLKMPAQVSDNESVQIDNVIDESQSTQDVSPLQAQRDWDAQAERNVLDRLVQAGLIAPPSESDKVLDQIVTNIIIGNNLALSGDVHCRILLTIPLESVAVGNTILVSKGLVDVLPSEADLAAVLSFQLAQIALGHEIDTRYAFDDRLLFPDEATFHQLHLNHSGQDDAASAQEAIKLLDHSIYRDKLAEVALFLAELQAQEKNLKALMTPNLGDAMIRPDGSPWLSGVAPPAHIQTDNVAQIAALPLGSRLIIDPWDDEVSFSHAAPQPILAASDKMPLEVTPIYFRLRRYGSSAASPSASGADPSTNAPAGNVAPGGNGASPNPPNPPKQ